MSSPGRPSFLRRAALTATLLTTVGTGLVALPAPAEASITTLCSGYTSCAAKGMGNAGYSSVNHTSFWQSVTVISSKCWTAGSSKSAVS